MSRVHWSKRHPSMIRELRTRHIAPEPVLRYSLLSQARLSAVLRACLAIQTVPGMTAEIGCASGGTSLLIATVAGRLHWACDTFEGLVDAGEEDPALKNGDFRNGESTFENVTARLSGVNARVVRGRFPESAPEEMRGTFALVHIDTDTYASMKLGFEFFAPLIPRGGYLILDDVIGKGTAGAKRFWSELDRSGWDLVEENDPHVVIRKQ